jgi:hypothetical protein
MLAGPVRPHDRPGGMHAAYSRIGPINAPAANSTPAGVPARIGGTTPSGYQTLARMPTPKQDAEQRRWKLDACPGQEQPFPRPREGILITVRRRRSQGSFQRGAIC